MASAIPVPGAPLSGDGSVLPYAVAPGPPRRGPLAGSVDTVALAAESVTADKLDPSVLRRRMRTAACSLGGASSTAGAFALINWAPSAARQFRLRVICASSTAHTGTVRILGRAAANFATLAIGSNGAISLQADGVQMLTSISGVYAFDGLPHDVFVDVTDTSASIYYDGAVVASGTFAAQPWSLVASANYVGSHSNMSANRWPGSVQLAEWLDLAAGNTANSIRLLMDEGVDVATYANSYPGSTAPATATKLTGQGYPWVCAVVSHDGAGRPWTGSPNVLYYAAQRGATNQVMDGSVAISQVATFDSKLLDPTTTFVHGSGSCVVPYAGLVEVHFQARVAVSPLTDGMTVVIRRGTAFMHEQAFTSSLGAIYSISCMFAVNAGDSITALVSGIDPAHTTFAIHRAVMTVKLQPIATTL